MEHALICVQLYKFIRHFGYNCIRTISFGEVSQSLYVISDRVSDNIISPNENFEYGYSHSNALLGLFTVINFCFFLNRRVTKCLSCSTELSMKFQQLAKTNKPKSIDLCCFQTLIVSILTFMSMMDFLLSWVEHIKSFITSRLGHSYNSLYLKWIHRLHENQFWSWSAGDLD